MHLSRHTPPSPPPRTRSTRRAPPPSLSPALVLGIEVVSKGRRAAAVDVSPLTGLAAAGPVHHDPSRIRLLDANLARPVTPLECVQAWRLSRDGGLRPEGVWSDKVCRHGPPRSTHNLLGTSRQIFLGTSRQMFLGTSGHFWADSCGQFWVLLGAPFWQLGAALRVGVRVGVRVCMLTPRSRPRPTPTPWAACPAWRPRTRWRR